MTTRPRGELRRGVDAGRRAEPHLGLAAAECLRCRLSLRPSRSEGRSPGPVVVLLTTKNVADDNHAPTLKVLKCERGQQPSGLRISETRGCVCPGASGTRGTCRLSGGALGNLCSGEPHETSRDAPRIPRHVWERAPSGNLLARSREQGRPRCAVGGRCQGMGRWRNSTVCGSGGPQR